MWVSINVETNRYCQQRTDRRAREILAQQGPLRRETLTQIRRRLMAKSGYQTHEILHVVGLLIARMLCPQKRSFAAHWAMTEDGAVPSGNFGRFMGRNRCQEILRDLNFVDNEAERTRDKLWKLRPVVDKVQQRFLAGWTLPAVFSFDEGVLPSTSRRNTTRMFTPDKPHRYGSKMFMLCDSRTAYCHRFEMYVGKRSSGASEDNSVDHKTGAAAVVRNLKAVLEANQRHLWHLVVVDRFYSSVLLAIELLISEDATYIYPRGTFLFSRSVDIPTMVAFHWWDRKPVQYLCTGSAMTASSI
ncbi:Hypothetical protein PHPALM_20145 [Phytophthora palmivora]|uniref:PiggyBac transposable element-derived protein domain-containing protein n=1 Tax=Phytophthora palmivora TaxID=4796 RepID=A0A2P4XFL1_9STRA|nr:Hypothetical protein PHPALM_20145 [Phytophthora palmivora]